MGHVSGLAITSLVMGILSLGIGWIPLFGLIWSALPIIFGIIVLYKSKTDKHLEGKGMAIAGIVMGSIMFFIGLMMFGLIGLATVLAR